MKSGVEHLAQHPGWKTQEAKGQYVKIEAKELEALVTQANDALDGGMCEDFTVDTLYCLRDALVELVEDPDRRLA